MKVLRNRIRKMLSAAVLTFAAALCLGMGADTPFGMKVMAAERVIAVPGDSLPAVSDNSLPAALDAPAPSVSDNSVPPVSDNSVPEIPAAVPEETVAEEPVVEEAVPEPALPEPDQLQTINYKQGALTDWTQISEALKTLTPDALTNPDMDSRTLVFQLQNVKNIPAEVKDGIAAADGSGFTKVLQCNLGFGVDLVLNGAQDNSGFTGISNTGINVISEKRGKKSVATTVRFESHENLGTVAALQVNLPQCGKGTKVSVYAETITTDAEGNAVVGENVCIGTTKAGENGSVEILIQSTANYMFVYKE